MQYDMVLLYLLVLMAICYFIGVYVGKEVFKEINAI